MDGLETFFSSAFTLTGLCTFCSHFTDVYTFPLRFLEYARAWFLFFLFWFSLFCLFLPVRIAINLFAGDFGPVIFTSVCI